ncbi:hypothetical protein C3F09_09890 [candidate division GN15 bacterium]|uniref:Ribosomal RNA small subunit methyltransferase G n=1 Tax=candidate division GN15 bacterium TaxID=2072418 RepID=A0A855WYJ3_9BACT|nr:MAG: hypothetical protein C3F09_09890 [candidate division GN15 bacterium]
MSTTAIDFSVDSTLSKHSSREALDRYYVELMKENASVNLVSRETSRDDFNRLCAESLLPLETLPERIGNYLDIGAGGGIPAVPLMQSGRISGKCVLVERTRKKAASLQRIVNAIQLPGETVNRTFEELSLRDRFDLITLRYVKLDRTLLGKIIPLLSANGRFVYYSNTEIRSEKLNSELYGFADPVEGILKHFTVFRTK